MARIACTSNAKEAVVGKLLFESNGPFKVVSVAELNSYEVRRYGKLDSALQKFSGDNLYLLPCQILPCISFDTLDQRFLNRDFAPLYHPLTDDFEIEGYNVQWFDDEPASSSPSFVPPLLLPVASPEAGHPVSELFDIVAPSAATG